MLKKLFKKKIKDNGEDKRKKELMDSIDKMDIYSMAYYLEKENSCELGIEMIINKLIKKDIDSKRRFIELSDSKFKINKCFDLIIMILEHNNITPKILSLAEKFVYFYTDIIREHDEKNKKDYEEKLNHALFFTTKKLSQSNNEEETIKA